MRTSLSNLQVIEQYLSGEMAAEERVLLEAKTIIDPSLAEDVMLQRKAYRLIQFSGREQLRAELDRLHARIATKASHRSYWSSILKIFQK